MNAVIIISLLAVVVLAIVHLLAGKMRFLDVTPRSVWLSIAGGISVAYVFVHLLPDLAEGAADHTGGGGRALQLPRVPRVPGVTSGARNVLRARALC